MPLTVVQSSLRLGWRNTPPDAQQRNAMYDLVLDGPILAGDIVVYGIGQDETGNWFAEWDNGAGPITLLSGPFSADGGVTSAMPTGQLVTNPVAVNDIYYQTILSGYLDDGSGNPLLRFGREATSGTSRFNGHGFAAWVLRGVSFNSIPAGSLDAKIIGFVCPFDLTPAPGQGVLTSNQMLFGMACLTDGGGATANVLSVVQNLAGFHPLSASGGPWNNAFGQNSFAACSIWGGPGQDATGQKFTFDTVPTGGTLPDVGNVSSQAMAALGLLDLTDVAPGVFAGFGFGGRFQDGG